MNMARRSGHGADEPGAREPHAQIARRGAFAFARGVLLRPRSPFVQNGLLLVVSALLSLLVIEAGLRLLTRDGKILGTRLVGLEVMAAGGLVFTGATGEEYARPWENAVVLDTDDAREIEATVFDLLARPHEMAALRRRAVETARQYTWEHVTGLLLRRLQYLAVNDR